MDGATATDPHHPCLLDVAGLSPVQIAAIPQRALRLAVARARSERDSSSRDVARFENYMRGGAER